MVERLADDDVDLLEGSTSTPDERGPREAQRRGIVTRMVLTMLRQVDEQVWASQV